MEPEQDSKITLRIVVEIVFFVLYFLLGMGFILIERLPFSMNKTMKIAFGLLLILYSAVRLFRIRKHLKER